MRLIRELSESVIHTIEEATETSPKKMYLEGKFMAGNVGNKNGRLYPMTILENETNRYITENVKKNKAYGELGHPATPTINLDRVAIHIKDLRCEGNDIMGKALIASTPMGQIVKGLIEDGANLGVSTRGLGSLKTNKQGLNEVQSDFKLAAIDVVSDPSGPNCFVAGIMENVEYIFDAAKGTYVEQHIDDIKKDLKSMSLTQITENQERIFKNFLHGLVKR